MKVPSFPLMLLMVVLLLNACKKDDDSVIVKTLEVSDIESHSATLKGEVVLNETPVTGRGFFWSETNTNPDIKDNLFILADLSTDFSAELTGLEPETKYYVRAYASDIKKVFHGQVVEFTTTSLSLSTLTTENITNISQTTATSGGNVTSDGGATVTARGVCWNTTGNPTIDDSKTTNGAGIGTFVSSITGLTANTTYYLRAYATNSDGTAYGEQIVFITTDGKDTQTTVVDVTNPATGKTWMDRNLGASRAATSSSDTEAYGDLYQWGRAADGHQKRNSFTTSELSNTNNPGHGYFITAIRHPDDWRSPQNTDLWQGESGTNNPCPSGYRLPTIAEWNAERLSWSSNNAAGAFASPMKLPVAGDRWRDYGELHRVGSNGYYWSSTVDGSYSRFLYFSSSSTATNFGSRAYGRSVRCIKYALSIPTVETTDITNITTTTATITGNIASDNDATITARGVCWNATGNPTIGDSKTTDVTGIGSWVSELVELYPNTTYYVRAYAINSQGIAYGEQIVFTTTESKDTQTAVIDVINPATGKTWMDRNLGASRAATSSTDTEAYGDLYQWGRSADGHQKRTSSTTSTLISRDTPWHGNFIMSDGGDWRSLRNDYLWQGVSGTNNPCPNGYRLPNEAEWNAERLSWKSNNAAGAFASPLKLTVAGYRSHISGSLNNVGHTGYYWPSTAHGSYSRTLDFSSMNAIVQYENRAEGRSVRCLKD